MFEKINISKHILFCVRLSFDVLFSTTLKLMKKKVIKNVKNKSTIKKK